MISSELEEVLGMSDRVMVMHEGQVDADAQILAMPRKNELWRWPPELQTKWCLLNMCTEE